MRVLLIALALFVHTFTQLPEQRLTLFVGTALLFVRFRFLQARVPVVQISLLAVTLLRLVVASRGWLTARLVEATIVGGRTGPTLGRLAPLVDVHKVRLADAGIHLGTAGILQRAVVFLLAVLFVAFFGHTHLLLGVVRGIRVAVASFWGLRWTVRRSVRRTLAAGRAWRVDPENTFGEAGLVKGW